MEEFKPYPFQEADLQTLAENNYTALVNIQTGGGKTPLAVWAAMRSGAERVLIVTPQNTFKGWIKTVKALSGQDLRVIGNSLKAQREAMLDFRTGFPGWYAVTPQLMGHPKTSISGWDVDMIISDEVHNYNRPDGKTSKKWIELAHKAPMRLALSGTPARRDFSRMWTNMVYLWGDTLYRRGEVAHSNSWVWQRDRMIGTEIYTSQRNYDGTPKKVIKWESEKEPGRLLREAPCVIQHFRRERCCEFHPEGFLSHEEPMVIERTVSLLPEQKKIIRQLEDQYIAWLDSEPLVVDLTLTQKMRIRQVCLGVPTLEEFEVVNEDGVAEVKQTLNFEPDCKSPVADEVLDILNHLDDNEPVIVHVESQRFARVLTGKLNAAGYSAAEYSGQTVKERDSYLERFGKDIQVIVGVTSAIANGTDGLQERSSVEIYAETHIDDTLVEQSQARLDRMNSKGQVMRFVIVDDLGYATGQLGSQLTKRLAIRQSMRKV